MKIPDKRDKVNLALSAFLVTAFVVCSFFFTQFAKTTKSVLGTVILVALYTLFGLLLFYATRVGDGKAIKRFSIFTLLIMVVPSLLVIVLSIAPGMPLYDLLGADEMGGISVITSLACVALGYGIPYTFLSGFELSADEDEETVEDEEVLEGGVMADVIEEISDDENDDTAEDAEEAAEENAEPDAEPENDTQAETEE